MEGLRPRAGHSRRLVPGRAGRLGGGAVENMIVMEEFGKALVVEPYLSTVVIGLTAKIYRIEGTET
jgi:hypothetical protein